MKRNSHGFVNQIVLWSIVTIFCGGSVGLGMVYVRQQISSTANTNRALVATLADIERRIAETNTLIEGAQTPEELRRRNTEWNLGLVPVRESQIVHVNENPMQRMARRANSELFLKDAPAPRVSLQISLNR